jgi:hypothetical protein
MNNKNIIKLNNIQKLDIVYTYVNNRDPKWIKKYSSYYDNIIDNDRFNFNGEIYFSLLTVQKFFNWINNIYIVNDNQIFDLSFLNKNFRKKIIFVDHSKIIPKEFLPTFNSMVIECFLWKIKNLSDFFIYLNDDIFFGNFIYYSDYFTENNVFKTFAVKKYKYYSYKKRKEGNYLIPRYNSERTFNTIFNTNYHFHLAHTSHNFNKHVCKYTFFKFYKYIKNTFSLKIRKYDSLNTKTNCFLTLLTLMSIHLNIIKISEIKRLKDSVLDKNFLQKIFDEKPKIFCINDLNNNSLNNWKLLQKNYFKLFNDKEYEKLIKKII